MKLNNKGMTIIEILISIVLVALVLMFLFRLLIEIKNEDENTNYTVNNQLNKAELIDLIETDLDKHVLVGIQDDSEDAGYERGIQLLFYYENTENPAVLTINGDKYADKYSATYIDYNGIATTYEMKGAKVCTCGRWKYYEDDINYYFKIIIPIYNLIENDGNNSKNNNAVDDIYISGYGNKSNIRTNAKYLTSYNSYSIGECTISDNKAIEEKTKIKIVSISASKKFDGAELYNKNYSLIGKLDDGDYIKSINFTGIQTNPGTSSNTFDSVIIFNSKDEDVTNNYEIEKEYGMLTVLH